MHALEDSLDDSSDKHDDSITDKGLEIAHEMQLDFLEASRERDLRLRETARHPCGDIHEILRKCKAIYGHIWPYIWPHISI